MVLTAVTIKSRIIPIDATFQSNINKACADDVESKLALGFSTYDYLTVVENAHGVVALMGFLVEIALYQIHLPAFEGQFNAAFLPKQRQRLLAIVCVLAVWGLGLSIPGPEACGKETD